MENEKWVSPIDRKVTGRIPRDDSTPEKRAMWDKIERAATDAPAERVTRVEVIDHRADTDTFGRAFTAWNVAVTLSYQDNGRTLKVFVDDAHE